MKKERESERAPAAIAAPVGHAQRSRAQRNEGHREKVQGWDISVWNREKVPEIRV